MKPKTEELLYLLLWACDHLTRPTFRNLTDSFETWAYRNGLGRQLQVLEQSRLIERQSEKSDARVYRLSNQGRLHALGGRDPAAEWNRYWDGTWRMVLFDVALGQEQRRKQLRRYLRERAFGCLQGSVWITPDPLIAEREMLRRDLVNAASLLLIEGRPCAGESDLDLVQAAWDFQRINEGYQRYVKVLEQFPGGAQITPQSLYAWAKLEREAWLDAAGPDPLLPERLLPGDYGGRTAWAQRVEVLAKAGKIAHLLVGSGPETLSHVGQSFAQPCLF